MSDQRPQQPQFGPGAGGARPRGEFFNRVGYYFFGVAIGLVLLGLIWQARARRAATMQQQQQQQQPAPAQP